MPPDSPAALPVAFYDTKSYDRDYFERAPGASACAWRFHEFRLALDSAATAAGSQAVCVFVNDRLDRACLTALAESGVRHIALRCAGFNHVDLTAAKELGLTLTRVPAYSPHAVAEHTLALLLTLNRKIHRAYNRVREHNFSLQGLVGFDIHGRTVGVVGTGKIGRIVAEIFRGFGAEVSAFDPFPAREWAARHGVEYRELEEVMARSDILTLHVPLTPETHYLLNERSLGRIKPGAYIINTSRGKLIDTTALLAALKAGRVGGVALDVYEEEAGVFFEDLSDEVLQDDELTRLLTFPNVLVTAHQAFLTQEALGEIARVTIENLWRVARGAPPLDGTAL